MLDLGKGNMIKELDKELVWKVSLVTGESFNCDEDGRGGNDKGVQSVNSRRREKSKSDQLRVRWGHVGRFVRGRCWEIWHQYKGRLECR